MLFTKGSRGAASRGVMLNRDMKPVKAARIEGQRALQGMKQAGASRDERQGARQEVRQDIERAKQQRAQSRGLGGIVRTMADRAGGLGSRVRELARGRTARTPGNRGR